MLCPKCNIDNAESSSFCAYCGAPMPSAADTASESASVTPAAPLPALFENETGMSLELQVKLNQLALTPRLFGLIIAAFVLGVLFLILGITSDPVSSVSIGAGIACMFISVFFLIVLLRPEKNIKARWRNSPLQDDNVIVRFRFTAAYLNVIETRLGQRIGDLTINYEYFNKVIEKDGVLFLYTNPYSAYLLDGKNMLAGTFNGLTAFLRMKLGAKYFSRK